MLRYYRTDDGTTQDHINWSYLNTGDQLIVGNAAHLYSTGVASTLFYLQGGNSVQVYGELVSTATTLFTNGSSSGTADIRVFAGGSITSATSYALDITTGGSVYNAGTISGWFVCVRLGGTNNTVTNDGVIVSGGNGVEIGGSNNGVTNTGTIIADFIAVGLGSSAVSSHSILNNSGTITSGASGGLGAVNLSGAGLSTIVNTGSIVATGLSGVGVNVNSSSSVRATHLDLVNSGTIQGDYAGVGGGDFADHVANTGLIAGAILLGKGDDIYDGTGGTVDGMVSGDDGDDTLAGGTAGDRLSGGAGLDDISGGDGNDIIDGGGGADMIDGGAGRDIATYASAASYEGDLGVTVDLDDSGLNTGDAAGDELTSIEVLVGSGGRDSLYGTSARDTLVGGGGADLLVGRGGNDVLRGGDGGDTLDGGAGNDALRGGDGIDVASYATATAGVTVNLTILSAQNTGGSGHDTLTEIESLTGSAFADRLTGDDGANTLLGGDGNDILNGGLGQDILVGGLGDDKFAGGGDVDLADYQGAASGVTVDLTITTAQNTGGAGRDTLSGIEYLYGSEFADTLTGDSHTNFLGGFGGNDTIDGGSGDDLIDGGIGNDTLDGGDNNDILLGGVGNDTLIGGAGVDTAYYVDPTTAVTIDLSVTGQQNTHGDGLDTLTGIENLLGSNFGDTLRGNDANNLLDGSLGDDRLFGGAGNDRLVAGGGNDLLNGGANFDTADYSGSQHSLFVDFSPGSASALDFMDLTLDTFVSIEGVIGSEAADSFLAAQTVNKATGGGGADSYRFDAGNAGGDTITDFSGATGDGDTLTFRGFGTNGTFTQIDATHWQVQNAIHSISEIITFSNAAAINVATDVTFGV